MIFLLFITSVFSYECNDDPQCVQIFNSRLSYWNKGPEKINFRANRVRFGGKTANFYRSRIDSLSEITRGRMLFNKIVKTVNGASRGCRNGMDTVRKYGSTLRNNHINLFVFPCPGIDGIAAGGPGVVRIWGVASKHLVIHEVGHRLGLNHSRVLGTRKKRVANPKKPKDWNYFTMENPKAAMSGDFEYTYKARLIKNKVKAKYDGTSFMASAGRGSPLAFNTPEMHWLGWFEKNEVIRINPNSELKEQEYTLTAINNNTTPGVKALVYDLPMGNRLFISFPRSGDSLSYTLRMYTTRKNVGSNTTWLVNSFTLNEENPVYTDTWGTGVEFELVQAVDTKTLILKVRKNEVSKGSLALNLDSVDIKQKSSNLYELTYNYLREDDHPCRPIMPVDETFSLSDKDASITLNEKYFPSLMNKDKKVSRKYLLKTSLSSVDIKTKIGNTEYDYEFRVQKPKVVEFTCEGSVLKLGDHLKECNLKLTSGDLNDLDKYDLVNLDVDIKITPGGPINAIRAFNRFSRLTGKLFSKTLPFSRYKNVSRWFTKELFSKNSITEEILFSVESTYLDGNNKCNKGTKKQRYWCKQRQKGFLTLKNVLLKLWFIPKK